MQKGILNKIFKSDNFNSEELELVFNQFELVGFKKGELLIEEGKLADYYYFLEEGWVRSYAINQEGDEVTTNFYSKSDIIIDWHSFFIKKPTREFYIAQIDVKAWRISFSNFMKLFHIESFREVGRTRLVNNFLELKNHYISTIADEAKDRYKHLIASKKDLIYNMPLKYIASYLGVTDTSLSRIRRELAKK